MKFSFGGLHADISVFRGVIPKTADLTGFRKMRVFRLAKTLEQEKAAGMEKQELFTEGLEGTIKPV